MNTVLIVFTLTIQSSYAEDTEAEADEDSFDTVQFFITATSAWRVRTFSVDEDVHVYSLGAPTPDLADTVISSTEKTYGDVIAAKHVFTAAGGIEELKQELESAGWPASLKQSAQHGFAFWVPEGSDYRTRSTPES
ncbi:MAG TPA: hypothetical protein VIT67_11160 [Povalibacter sp.]